MAALAGAGAASVALAAPLPRATDAAGTTTLDVAFDSARNERGVIRVCLTSNPRHFPNCSGDTSARRLIVPAADHGVRFENLPAGTYAVALIHDENANGRMDMAMMMPREGFGFSRNPRIGMGPPRFTSASFAIEGSTVRQQVRIRYML